MHRDNLLLDYIPQALASTIERLYIGRRGLQANYEALEIFLNSGLDYNDLIIALNRLNYFIILSKQVVNIPV